MSEDEFAEFMQRVNDEVASKKTIYLTKCNGSKLAHPSWKKLLKTLSKTNVIELKGGDISPVPIPPIPRPWLPLPPNPVNPPWLDDPDGDSDFNCVPGIPGGPCRPVLLVIPEVDCRLLENSDYSFNFDKYSDYNPWEL